MLKLGERTHLNSKENLKKNCMHKETIKEIVYIYIKLREKEKV